MKTKKIREMTIAELIGEGESRLMSASVYLSAPFKDRHDISADLVKSHTLEQVLQLLDEAHELLLTLIPEEEDA